MEIRKNCFVVIEYMVKLDDGTVVKGENELASMNFIAGYNQILPALEYRLLGAKEGDVLEFTIPAVEAFGPYRKELVKFKNFEEFPEGKSLSVGKWVVATNPKTRAQYSYFVKEKTSEGVWLDFNHPLAGKDLHYFVKIIKVRPASLEELEYLRPCEFGREQFDD